MANQYPKPSVLHLSVRQGEKKTQIEDMHFTAPFKVISPFYDTYGHMQIMLLSVSAGIMAGDTQNLFIDVKTNAFLEVISQSLKRYIVWSRVAAHSEIQICA